MSLLCPCWLLVPLCPCWLLVPLFPCWLPVPCCPPALSMLAIMSRGLLAIVILDKSGRPPELELELADCSVAGGADGAGGGSRGVG